MAAGGFSEHGTVHMPIDSEKRVGDVPEICRQRPSLGDQCSQLICKPRGVTEDPKARAHPSISDEPAVPASWDVVSSAMAGSGEAKYYFDGKPSKN